MKLIYNGKVSVVAETEGDVIELISRYGGTSIVKRKHKPHKLHTYKKTCSLCGKVCKGNRGLATHEAKHYKAPNLPQDAR